MSFYSQIYLFFIALVPLVFLGAWLRNRAKINARKKFAEPDLFRQIATSEPASRGFVRAGIIAVAIALILFGLARPQAGEQVVEEEVEGIDIVLAIDVSRSMSATDLAPNRLSAIKNVTGQFINSSYGDRIGVVAFAGDAIVVCPLTTDHAAVYDYIGRLSTNEPLRAGTGIGNAIEVASNRLKNSDAGRVIILLTDGENNKGIEPMEAVLTAQEYGIRIYTVGIGTAEGSPMPDETKSVFGGNQYRLDSSGDPIIVRLDTETLRAVADQTEGRFFHVTNADDLRTLYSSITHEGEMTTQSRRTVRRDELAPFFIILASILLIFESMFTFITPSGPKPTSARSFRESKAA